MKFVVDESLFGPEYIQLQVDTIAKGIVGDITFKDAALILQNEMSKKILGKIVVVGGREVFKPFAKKWV